MATQNVSFLGSITIKVTLALMLAFIIIIGVVFYVVSNEGYEKIRAESSQVTIEQGKLTVSSLNNSLKSVAFNAEQIKENSEILPLEVPLFNLVVDNLIEKKSENSKYIVTANILPNSELKSYFTPIEKSISESYKPMFIKQNQDYTQSSWYQLVESTAPTKCLWNSLNFDSTSKHRSISCSLPIVRNNLFWGITNVGIDTKLLEDSLNQLNGQLDDGYALLIDNSNQVIASSNNDKIPVINKETDSPLTLSEYAKANPDWTGIISILNKQRNKSITNAKSNISGSVLSQLNKISAEQRLDSDSMLLNYAASLNTEENSLLNNSFIGKTTLQRDEFFRQSAQAFVFSVPETNWNLVIVQADTSVNSVAENLSKNLIKYVMFALIFMLAAIFFLLDYLALRPLEETSQKIIEADKLIDNNRYNQLSGINFSNISNDEIGIVNGSLKKLLQRIQDNEGKLANINQELEIKVEERTSELKNAMAELKSSQVQLIRSEKMATLGQMVAGVAHEVNTPLTYVQNNVEIIGQLTEQYEELVEMVTQLKTVMMDQETPEDDIENLMGEIIELADELEEDEISAELKDLIKDSLFGVEQITEMVLNLRNFARLDESKVKKTDLRECITTSLKIAQNAVKHHDVEVDLPDIPEIECSPSQINQVIINLLNNASQAIGEKTDGRIDISTSSDSTNVYITIKDNGSGMSPEVLSKIFEPFFTTKGAGEGTGLGMAISQQIMEQHNGEIRATSTEGVGTEFYLQFPINGKVS